ncbi:hypothetical protein HN873_043858 [Arachis hypogaea]
MKTELSTARKGFAAGIFCSSAKPRSIRAQASSGSLKNGGALVYKAWQYGDGVVSLSFLLLGSNRTFKNLQFLEICGRELTDGGVKHIKEMTSLTQLNLSQNCNLTDKILKLLSGMTALRSLNISNTGVTSGNTTISSSSPRVLRIWVLFTLNYIIGRSVKATATFWPQ